jgi:hypothetical protein
MEVYSMTKDIAPNDESIFDRVRNGTWLKETYGLIKKKGPLGIYELEALRATQRRFKDSFWNNGLVS